jgi:sugar phosphate isomerase/epimerase
MINLYLHTYSLRCHFQYLDGFDVFTFIDRAASLGFTGVSISANGPGYRHLGGTDTKHFDRVRERIASLNLLCDMDTSGTSPDHLETMIGVARAISAAQVRTYTRHTGTPEEMVSLTTDDLLAVAPIAEEAGVTIMLENHENFTGDQIARILEQVDSPRVRALYDYGNSMMVLEHPFDALAAMAPLSANAHLKDHLMISPEDSPDGKLSVLGVPIGQGNLPIIEITRRLLDAGLRNITFENVWGYRAAVKATPDRSATLGEGVFAIESPPFDPARCLLDIAALAANDPQKLIELEAAAMDDGLNWLNNELERSRISITKSHG